MPPPTAVKEGQCEACRVFIDGIEEHYLDEYRGHNICFHCQVEWRRREELAGREITWEEFTKGR